MKKAKIVLSAVALFAVIGGAFAFKATRIPQPFYKNTTTTTTTALVCTATTSLLYTTANNGRPTTFVSGIHTTSTTLPCPGLTVRPIE
jgi:hypothetical protein